jgi:hypothetical protein
MRSITRSHRPLARSRRHTLNLGELVNLCHEHARARGLDEEEANEVTARLVGRALGNLGNRRLLGVLAATSV